MTQWDNRTLTKLKEIMANLYPVDSDARQVASKAGLRIGFITFE
jgi:hypothetical protein